MNDSFDVVCCSLEDWDDVWRRNQFLVRELFELDPACRVLFVEPPHDVVHALRRGENPRRATGSRRVDGMPRLSILKPTKVLPRVLGAGADRHLASQVERAARELGFTQPLLWINDAAYAALAGRVRWPTVYDITDDWLLAAAASREQQRREARERFLLSRADEVVVCSPGLTASRESVRPVRLIPNAVDAAHYAAPTARPADLPAAPVALYVGTLHRDRLDVDLVGRVAAEAPSTQLVFVGPVALDDADTRALGAYRNVHLLGPRPWSSVAAYMQHADVLMVPHVVSPFTESLDPLKAYEYLAAGRPVVTTNVAGFRDLELPHVARVDADGFAAALVAATASREPIRVPDLPSWRDRATAFRDALLDAQRASSQRPLRVAYFDHSAELSGAELALARLLPALPDVDATVVLAEAGPLEARLRDAGIASEVVPLSPRTQALRRGSVAPGRLPVAAMWDSVRYVRTLRAWLRAEQPDVVHTNSLKAAIYGTIAGRLSGVPVVCHVRDRIADDYLPRAAVVAVRGLLRYGPTALIANSSATMATVGRHGTVIHDIVERPAPHTRATGGPFCVGMVGRIAPWKGQHIFLEAFAAAFGNSDARARVVGAAMFGEHDYETRLHDLVTRLGVSDRVDFVGFVDDVYPQLALMDVVVHASVIAEPFGQVIVEAMAAGVPVIATAAGGPLEIIDDGVSGLLVPPDNVAALVDAFQRLRDDPALRARLATNASQTATRFEPDVIARQVRAVYTAVTTR